MKMNRRMGLIAGALASATVWAADVTINVPAGVTNDFYTALAANGYQKSDLNGQRIVKTGGGVLIGTNDLTNASGNHFHKLLVKEGVFSVRVDGDFGQQAFAGDAITVESGATIRLAGSGINILNRAVWVEGDGAGGAGGAIVCDGYGQNSYGQFRLNGNVTFFTRYSGDYALVFMQGSYPDNPTTVNLNGHDVILKAAGKGSRYGYRISAGFRVNGSGRFVVDGTYLGQGSAIVSNHTSAANNGYVTLALKNGATFRPRTQSMVSFFDAIDAEAGTTIAAGESDAPPFDMYLSDIVGAPAATALSSLNISGSMTVRVSDISAGNHLSVDGVLAFGADALLKIEGDVSGLVPDANGRVKLASSATGISGVPVLVATKANRNWSVETGDEGRSLYLRYASSKPAGAIDVFADWGVLKGADNAAGNAARFNSALAALASSGAILYFPAGEYWFDAPLSIAKSGVTVVGDACESVLNAATGFSGTSLMSITGSGVTVSGLTLGGVGGPAVTASGTASLTVTNNNFTVVGGAIDGSDEKYPVVVLNGTGTFVRDNLVMDGATYTAPALIDGGTKAADGEPLDGLVRIRVDAGEELTIEAAFARTGFASWPANARLVKTGAGTLVGTAFASSSSAVLGITVESGIYSASADYFGKHDFGIKDQVYVKNGATVLFSSASATVIHVNNRILFIEGAGAPGMGGAIAALGNGMCRYAQFKLTGNATFAAHCTTTYARFFDRIQSDMTHPSRIELNGYTATLKSARGGMGVALLDQFQFLGKGTFAVDGTVLAQNSNTVVPYNSSAAKLALRNGAKFLPRTQDIVELFSEIDCDATSQVVGGDGSSAAFAMTIGGWAGCGAVGSGFTSLTITNSMAVSAADLAAGRHMTAACPLAFAAGVKMSLSGTGQLDESVPAYTCAVSEVSVDGCPVRAAGSDFRLFRPMRGTDGRSIILKRVGFIMSFR